MRRARQFAYVQLSTRAPAKINLSLAVVGREADGFHRLVSCMVPITLADSLTFVPGGQVDVLACDEPTIPVDQTNLVLRAAAVFRAAHAAAPRGHFWLSKAVPQGAGLGGGSSDAVAALRLLNEASGFPFDADGLRSLATKVGSDCAFFVGCEPCVMRGRGERLDGLPLSLAAAWRGRRVLLVKPARPVSTASAYGWIAESGAYLAEARAEAALAEAIVSGKPESFVALGNSLQASVFAHNPELPAGLAALRSDLGIEAFMTGSGSACFALVEEAPDLNRVRSVLGSAWGPGVWVALTELA